MSRHCVLPSLTAMFQFGMPSMDNMETVITDIDEQLSLNDKKIEETLQKLVQATNSLSLDNNYTNIKDAMDSLIQTPVLEECACLTPDAEDVNKLLKIILQQAISHPRSESIIFEQLLGLASHEGLGLPIRAPKPSYVAASSLSINTINDSLEQENDSLWEDIRSRLKRHFFEKLQATVQLGPGEVKSPARRTDCAQRINSLQSLCILYPIKEVWMSYRTLVSDKVNMFLRKHLKSSPLEAGEPCLPPTLGFVAATLAALAPHFHALMEEECAVHVADVFEGEVAFREAVQEVYLSPLRDELQGMMEEAWEGFGWRRGGAKGGVSSNGSATKSIGASEWLNGGQDLGGKEQIKKTAAGEDKPLMSSDDIKDFIAVVTLLHMLNEHLCQLSQHATWDVGTLFKVANEGRGNLRGVLKHHREGGTVRDIRIPSDYTGRGLLPEAIPPPFGVMPGMVGSEYNTQRPSHVQETPIQQKSKWNWSSVLEIFTSLVIRSITKLSEDGLGRELFGEEEKMRTERKVLAVECVSRGNPTQIYLICQSLASACKFSSSILPLVAIAADKVLQPIQASVIENMLSLLHEVSQHLTKLLEIFNQSTDGPPQHKATKDLCVLLSSTIWLLEEISHYERLITEDDDKRSFAAIKKQVIQLQTVIRQQIVSSHMAVISTIILHDAESHNWADQRPCFEDGRCSYSTQMWHLYLGRLKNEMFSVSPPSVAQDVFASVLSESLTLLSYRYNKAQPSYKRTHQFRCDITSILLTTLTHLWSACSTPRQLLSPPSLLSSAPHFPLNSAPLGIHNSATCLLTALAVVSSPLPDLYKVFKKGYQQKSGTSSQKSTAGREGCDGTAPAGMENDQRLWLAWIRPGLFDQLEQGWNCLPDKTASFILLKLLACQPAPDHGLTLQTLLSRDALLATLMMSNTGASVRYELSTILQPLIDVLILCNDHPSALCTVIMAVIEKQDNWPMFRYDSLPGRTTTVPDWLSCLFTVLKPFMTRGIREASEMLMKKKDLVETTGFLQTLGELPCGCRPKHRTAAATTYKQEKDVIFGALKILLTCIAEDAIALPTPVKIFFFSLQEKVQENGIRACHNCVALQVIGSCAYAMLSDEEEVARIVGDSVPEGTTKKFSQLGEYAFLSLTATSNHGTQEKLPNSLHTFVKLHSDWLQEQIDIVIDHLGNESLGHLTNYTWDESSLDFVEEYYTLQADNVMRARCGFPSGENGLLKINKLFRNNVYWFQHHLEIPPLLQTGESHMVPVFNPDTFIQLLDDQTLRGVDPPTRPPFNPITEMNRLDDSPFEHSAISNFPFDWVKVLQSDLGLSETGFRSLLSHRHEMQEDACLEESERKPVRVLRSKFDLDKGDLV